MLQTVLYLDKPDLPLTHADQSFFKAQKQQYVFKCTCLRRLIRLAYAGSIPVLAKIIRADRCYNTRGRH